MAVFLNSSPQEDGNALTGGAVSIGNIPGVYFVADYNVVTYREESQGSPQWLELTSGGQFVGIWDSYGTYLEPGDTGFSFRWKFWARGSGTVALTQDTDPGWDTSALPAPSIGNLVVSAVDWTLYDVAADPIVLADFLDFDGIRLGLNLTSGAVDITTIQLECVPNVVVGGWAPQPAYDANGIATSHSADGLALTDENDPDRETAWDLAYAAALAANPLDEPDPTVMTIQDFGYEISADVPAWVRSGPVISPPGFFGQFNLGARKTWVNVGGGFPALNGVEGVDYTRIPGFTIYDGNVAFTRDTADLDNLPTTYVTWDDPHAEFTWAATSQGGPWDDVNASVNFYLVEEDAHADAALIDWTARGTPVKNVTPTSTTPELEAISLPSSGAFALYAVAAALEGSTPVFHDSDVILYWDARMEVLSGTTTSGGVDQLTYSKHYNPFSQWSQAGRLTKLRQNQRGDGLGRSPRRARGHQSRQASNRQRGYR